MLVVIHCKVRDEIVIGNMYYMYQVAKYIELIGENLMVGVSLGAISNDLAI